MTIPVLICDDSGFARKQLARSLPADWDVELHYAANGAEAIGAIENGNADILFLDLNMPVMDGYQVLEVARARDLPTMIIVVSGDVQEQAKARVMALGALDFITKPVDPAEVEQILQRYGVLQELKGARRQQVDFVVDPLEGYQEVANVAMGQAAARLAKVLGVFVELPIPKVRHTPRPELNRLLAEVAKSQRTSVVSQGFVGSGVAGEALLLFADAQFADLAQLLAGDSELTSGLEVELLMEISNLLIGACLTGFCSQLDLDFSVGHPTVLARSRNLHETPLLPDGDEAELRSIEIHYAIEEYRMNFHLLLLFDQASITPLDERIGYLVDGLA